MVHVDRRLVALDGATNFRDIGGYRAADGRAVRWGSIYRSDSLEDLTPSDVGRLLHLELREVLDLRSAREVEAFGTTPLTGHGVVRHHVGFLPEPLAADLPPRITPVATDHAAFAAHYLELLEGAKAPLCRAFTELAEAETHAVVFHCTAGRDRTGLTAGLLLSLLGVDDEVVADDYQLTERFLRIPASRLERLHQIFDRRTILPESPPTPAPVMRLTLAGVRERYGSAEGYLREAGLPNEVTTALRRRLLMPDE
jgi:protein-tyrosine phosphatase